MSLIDIKVSCITPDKEIQKIFSQGITELGGFRFHVNTPIERCAAWFVFDGLRGVESTVCPKENIIFIMGEAPAWKLYDNAWLNQFFARVLGYGPVKHPGFFQNQKGQPWFIHNTYDNLKNSPLPKKTKKLSVISSTKKNIGGHRRRVEFINALGELIEFDMYGRGWDKELPKNSKAHYIYCEPLEKANNKAPALEPYEYSVAIDNQVALDYWDEKISDCVLLGTIPFYYGAPNIGAYFPKGSYVDIDIKNPRQAAEIIARTMNSNFYQENIPAVQKAKDLMLDYYSLSHVMVRQLALLRLDAHAESVTVQPEPEKNYWQYKLRKLRRKFCT